MAAREDVLTAQHRFLLELSRDIDRNLSDHEFSEIGGKIHYVFDENIFEYLIGLKSYNKISVGDLETSHKDKRLLSAGFHREEWRSPEFTPANENEWKSVNRQLAAITSEYLFSGALPGQISPGHIYVSQWHWQETVNRCRILSEHIRQLAKGVDNQELEGFRELLNDAALLSPESSELEEILAAIRKHIPNFSLVDSDLERLKDEGISLEDRRSFAYNFFTALILASENPSIPSHIISRVFRSSDIGARIKPLYLLGTVPKSADLRRGAREWRHVISEEVKHQRRPSSLRSNTSLLNDAYTLAYVNEVAKSLSADERICFVTGDELIFDAYRREWLQNDTGPFLLRRPMQYSPLINAQDMDIGIPTEEIFENIRVAIEPALMFFNLGREIDIQKGSNEASRSVHLNVGREFLALYLKTNPSLDKTAVGRFFDATKDTPSNAVSIHSKIGQDFRELERLSIGAAYKFLRGRYEQVFDKELSTSLIDSESFSRYIERKLDEVFEVNAQLHVPLALRSVRRWLNDKRSYDIRVPIASVLHIPSADTELLQQENLTLDTSLVGFVDSLLVADPNRGDLDKAFRISEENRWMLRDPELLFAVACIIALRIRFWEEAAEYGEISMKAAHREFQSSARNKAIRYLECVYLFCIARRFDIVNSTTTHESLQSEVSQLHELNRGTIQLIATERAYADRSPIELDFLELRMRSETIALSAFCIAKVITDTSLSADQNVVRSVIDAELLKASSQIDTAGNILEEMEKHQANFSLAFNRAFETVRRQLIANISSLYCLREAFCVNFEGFREIEMDDAWVLKRAKSYLKDGVMSEFPRIAELEVVLYLFLNEPSPKLKKAIRRTIAIMVEKDWMRMDRALVDMYLIVIDRKATT